MAFKGWNTLICDKHCLFIDVMAKSALSWFFCKQYLSIHPYYNAHLDFPIISGSLNVIFRHLFGSVDLLSHNTLKWSVILRLSFFARCWWSRESVLQGSRALSEFRTSLSKVLTLWHCVKVKQCYLCTYKCILFYM